MRRFLVLAVLIGLALAGVLPGPAAAADVNATLVAVSFQFHLDSATGTPEPTIVVDAGDTLRLRIENQDAVFHTFTFPHFGIDLGLDNGSATQPDVSFVDIPTSSADAGTWQFWCRPHSSGSDPENRVGMIGRVQIRSTAPPTPGFEVLISVAAILAAVGVAMIVLPRRQR